MLNLGEPLGWDASFRNNISKQDDYLEELNITTYNSFKEYLFWDVIEALSKVHLVNTDMKSDSTGGLGHMPTDEDIYHTDNNNSVDGEGNTENNSPSKILLKNMGFTSEQKTKLRLELEFEKIDDKMHDVMDVEEIRKKQIRIKSWYMS